MKTVELYVSALNSNSSSPGNFILVLQTKGTEQKISFTIGLQEAQAIAIVLDKLKPIRPLTHDLFLTTLDRLNARIENIKITGVKEGIYTASMIIHNSESELIEIECRPSDAIALALRQNCPIIANEELVILMMHEMEKTKNKKTEERTLFESYSIEKLYESLTYALVKEDFEKAAIIRDIIALKG